MEVDPRIGTTVQGRYRILERISGGAMGVVYRGERIELGRQVAVKFLHPMFASTPELIKRFEREARTMSRLDHPHCVSVIDLGVDGGPFIVMDFVTGTTLLQLLEAGPLPPPRAAGILQQILAGLAHAHERGVIHRDIKPANVMLTNPTGTGDHARILDFGLARIADVDQSVSGIVAGTPSYMSPEQAAGKTVDARSDLYSCGVLFFQLLTDERPFESDQALELLRMHIEKPPPKLADLHPAGTFPPELEAFVARALAKSPDDRFQSADAMSAALTAAMTPSRAAAPSPPRPTPRPRPPARFPFALVIFLLVAGAGTYYAVTRKPWQTTDSAPKKPVAAPVGSLADAEQLAAAGQRDDAIAGLHELRRKTPNDARIPHLLGRLYAEKSWWSESLLSFREALDKHPAYRTDAALIDGVIRTLGEPKQHDLAAATLRAIGKPAISRLRTAAARHEVPSVRAAAAKLLPAQ